MSDALALDVPEAVGGLFGGSYLRACGVHDGARPAAAEAAGVRLPVLVGDGGALHTPYGYPQPEGDGDLRAFAEAALGCVRPWRAAPAPVGRGAELAALLAERLEPSGTRAIAVHDLIGDDAPAAARFSGTARSMVRRAQRAEAELVAGPVTPAFGRLYRAAMDALGADPVYHFDDNYLQAMNGCGGRQLTLHDADGLAAAALFLVGPREGSYHLSARRADPPPPPGAANLLIAEGLELCRAAGATLCYLGGGVGAGDDDPLLAFKRTMATRVVDRPTFTHKGRP